MLDPHAEYSKRLDARLQMIAEKEGIHIRLGNSKLVAAVAVIAFVWLFLGNTLCHSAGWSCR